MIIIIVIVPTKMSPRTTTLFVAKIQLFAAVPPLPPPPLPLLQTILIAIII